MSRMATLSRREMAEIQGLLTTEVHTSSQLKDRRLKELSEARVAKWPNTLAALRSRKEEAKSVREATEEADRRVIDRHEAERRAMDRKHKIDRANAIIYSQTDKMKVLRGKLLLVDVLKDRERQISERRRREDINEQQGKLWHDELLRQLAEHDVREAKSSKKRMASAHHVAEVQQQQLEQYRDTYIDSLMEEKEEGEHIKKKAIEDERQERIKEERKRHVARQNTIDVAKANVALNSIKAEQGALKWGRGGGGGGGSLWARGEMDVVCRAWTMVVVGVREL